MALTDPAPRDPRFASSLAHGLALLEAFAGALAGLSQGELARRSGLSKATVSRLIVPLAARRIVRVDPQTRRHRLGTGAVTLAYPMLAQFGVRGLARLAMKQLSDELGATVSLGIRDRHRVVYVECVPGSAPLAFRPDVGAALPLLQSAMGRAWLASADAPVRAAAIRQLRMHDPAGLRRWQPAIAAARDDLAAHGYCRSLGDWQPDIHAVAVPLAPLPDGERLMLNCGFSAARTATGELHARIAPALRALGQRIDAARQQQPEAAYPAPGDVQFRTAWAASPPDRSLDQATARTLASGLDLLAAWSPMEAWLGNAELARRIGRSPQTVARLTHTLVALGYLHRDAASARYRLGPATLSIAYPMLSNLRIRALARPVMQSLSAAIGGAVSIGHRHDTAMVYVETAWRPRSGEPGCAARGPPIEKPCCTGCSCMIRMASRGTRPAWRTGSAN